MQKNVASVQRMPSRSRPARNNPTPNASVSAVSSTCLSNLLYVMRDAFRCAFWHLTPEADSERKPAHLCMRTTNAATVVDSPTAKDTTSQQSPDLSVRAFFMNVAAHCCPAATEDPLKQ
ncbi:hypothetical protein [Streptomyces rimosus]